MISTSSLVHQFNSISHLVEYKPCELLERLQLLFFTGSVVEYE
jgi:hypothetical protein